jgi:hypothetical protein
LTLSSSLSDISSQSMNRRMKDFRLYFYAIPLDSDDSMTQTLLAECGERPRYTVWSL